MKKLMIALFVLMSISLSAVAQTPAQKGPAATHAKKDAKAPATTAVAAKPAPAQAAPAAHTKKDGTPDKRFKENKAKPAVHTKKDGTPDKRFKENKGK